MIISSKDWVRSSDSNMRSYCIVLSFFLLQSSILCHVIKENPGSYEIIDVGNKPTNDGSEAFWQASQISIPDEVNNDSWLKSLASEFRRVKEDDTYLKGQPELYTEQSPNTYLKDQAELYTEQLPKTYLNGQPEFYSEQLPKTYLKAQPEFYTEQLPKTYIKAQPQFYPEQVPHARIVQQNMHVTPEFYKDGMIDQSGYQMWDHAKVKKSIQMEDARINTNYPQYYNYISKQVDARSPEPVFVTFAGQPEYLQNAYPTSHPRVLDEYIHNAYPTSSYVQKPQRYTEEEYSQLQYDDAYPYEQNVDEKKDTKKHGTKQQEKKSHIFSKNQKVEKTEDEHSKKSMKKHDQDTKNMNYEFTSQQESQFDKKREEEFSAGSSTQNPAKYKHPLPSASELLLPKLKSPFKKH